nr:unnamed protein product [Callosobruchus chinensis]
MQRFLTGVLLVTSRSSTELIKIGYCHNEGTFFSQMSPVLFCCRGAEAVSEHNSAYWDLPPYFDNSSRREYVTTVGQTAHLHCRVRNLGDRAVSWIRKRDLHILTVGILTYTNDQRFQSLHTDGSDEWTLKVTSPQIRDSGIYECQNAVVQEVAYSDY